MKFQCLKTFPDSAGEYYQEEAEYPMNQETVLRLAALKSKDGPLGAMSRFTPIDEEARAFMAKLPGLLKKKEPKDTPKEQKEEGAPNPPKRADLLKKAKELGIKTNNKMKIPELLELIAER